MSNVRTGAAFLLSGLAGAIGLGLLFVLTVVGGDQWSTASYVMVGIVVAIGLLGGVAVYGVISKMRAMSTASGSASGTEADAQKPDADDPPPSKADVMGGGIGGGLDDG